jgi:hypothetical protein
VVIATAFRRLLWRALRATRSPGWFEEPLPDRQAPGPPMSALLADSALITQLFRGSITGAEYRRRMELLAARETERRPLAVPSPRGD